MNVLLLFVAVIIIIEYELDFVWCIVIVDGDC